MCEWKRERQSERERERESQSVSQTDNLSKRRREIEYLPPKYSLLSPKIRSLLDLKEYLCWRKKFTHLVVKIQNFQILFGGGCWPIRMTRRNRYSILLLLSLSLSSSLLPSFLFFRVVMRKQSRTTQLAATSHSVDSTRRKGGRFFFYRKKSTATARYESEGAVTMVVCQSRRIKQQEAIRMI